MREALRESRVGWSLAQALSSKMDHRLKSRGLRSGLLGGHSSLDRNHGMCSLHHCCVMLAECGGAESCWNDHGSSLKVFWAQGSRAPSRMSSL